MTLTEPIEGRWYWVTTDRKAWWPAVRSQSAAGGWTNEDTWEDFNASIVAFVIIADQPCECRCGTICKNGDMEAAHPEDYRGERG